MKEKASGPIIGGNQIRIEDRLAAIGSSLGGRAAGMIVVVTLGLVGTNRLIKHSSAGVDAFIVFAMLVVGLTLTRDPRAMLGRFVILGIYLMMCGFGYLDRALPSTLVGVIGVFFFTSGVGMTFVVARAQKVSHDNHGYRAPPDRRSLGD